MTIKELKEIIKDLDDDMMVGGCGHYGEFLDCYYANIKVIPKNTYNPYEKDSKIHRFFCIVIEDKGPEPD